jgi:hypothetical protein
LPHRVALWTFIRVYANTGECGPDYARVYDAWEAKGREGRPIEGPRGARNDVATD